MTKKLEVKRNGNIFTVESGSWILFQHDYSYLKTEKTILNKVYKDIKYMFNIDKKQVKIISK